MSRRANMRTAILFTVCLLPAMAQVIQRNELVLRIEPACALQTVSNTITGRATAGGVTAITGSTQFRYLLRTSRISGSGEVLLAFDPPPRGGAADVSYSASPLAGAVSRNGSTTTGAPPVAVAQFVANTHTTKAGAAGQISWTWRGPDSATLTSPLPRISINCR